MPSGTDRKETHDKHLGTLHFDPNMRSNSSPWLTWTHDNMVRNYDELESYEPDKILNIRVYESPLSGWQLTQAFFFHSFTVIETESWWYSIETSERNITMQRSKHLQDVLNRCEGEKRKASLFRVNSFISYFYPVAAAAQ